MNRISNPLTDALRKQLALTVDSEMDSATWAEHIARTLISMANDYCDIEAIKEIFNWVRWSIAEDMCDQESCTTDPTLAIDPDTSL